MGVEGCAVGSASRQCVVNHGGSFSNRQHSLTAVVYLAPSVLMRISDFEIYEPHKQLFVVERIPLRRIVFAELSVPLFAGQKEKPASVYMHRWLYFVFIQYFKSGTDSSGSHTTLFIFRISASNISSFPPHFVYPIISNISLMYDKGIL